jgi:hypothetical protein
VFNHHIALVNTKSFFIPLPHALQQEIHIEQQTFLEGKLIFDREELFDNDKFEIRLASNDTMTSRISATALYPMMSRDR